MLVCGCSLSLSSSSSPGSISFISNPHPPPPSLSVTGPDLPDLLGCLQRGHLKRAKDKIWGICVEEGGEKWGRGESGKSHILSSLY